MTRDCCRVFNRISSLLKGILFIQREIHIISRVINECSYTLHCINLYVVDKTMKTISISSNGMSNFPNKFEWLTIKTKQKHTLNNLVFPSTLLTRNPLQITTTKRFLNFQTWNMKFGLNIKCGISIDRKDDWNF